MPAGESDVEARVRAFMTKLLRELRFLGYRDSQLQGKTFDDVRELLDMRRRAYRHSMESGPESSKAA